MTKTLHRVLKQYGHWIFLGFMILLTVYMDVYVSRNILDGDTSDYVNRGWIMAQQHNPFTRDFFFTTEVRLLDISAVYSLFFHFTDDWTLVRILGAIAMQTWYVLSFLYVCKQAGLGKTSAVFGAGMLLVPFSTPYARLVLYHMYYILYLSNAFWAMGLTLRVFHTSPHQKQRAIWPTVFLAGLWIFMGLNGIRHMIMLGIPLMLYAGIKSLQMLNSQHWVSNLSIRRQPFWKTDSMHLVKITIGCLACFAVGFVINRVWLLPYYGVVDMTETIYRPTAPPQRYLNILHGWLIATGIRNSALSLMGIRGVALVSGLFIFTYLLYVSYQALKDPHLSKPNLVQGIFAASFASTTFIFLFESTVRIFEQYYVLVCAWALLVLIIQLERNTSRNAPVAKRLLALIACLCLLFQGAYTTLFLRADKNQMDKWECLYFDHLNAMDEIRDCVTFMQENGYNHAMTDYWYANVMMEMSDGKLTVAPMLINYQEDPSISLQEWGTSRLAFARENLPSTILIFIKREKADEFEAHYSLLPLVHEGWIFNGYEVDTSLIQLDKE